MDPDTTLVRVSCDGGGGSFKVIVNLFNPDEKEIKRGEALSGLITFSHLKASFKYVLSALRHSLGRDCFQGVNKCLVLAMVENIPERHFNLEAIFERLKLEQCKFSLASDFKCINLELGLSVSRSDLK